MYLLLLSRFKGSQFFLCTFPHYKIYSRILELRRNGLHNDLVKQFVIYYCGIRQKAEKLRISILSNSGPPRFECLRNFLGSYSFRGRFCSDCGTIIFLTKCLKCTRWHFALVKSYLRHDTFNQHTMNVQEIWLFEKGRKEAIEMLSKVVFWEWKFLKR